MKRLRFNPITPLLLQQNYPFKAGLRRSGAGAGRGDVYGVEPAALHLRRLVAGSRYPAAERVAGAVGDRHDQRASGGHCRHRGVAAGDAGDQDAGRHLHSADAFRAGRAAQRVAHSVGPSGSDRRGGAAAESLARKEAVPC